MMKFLVPFTLSLILQRHQNLFAGGQLAVDVIQLFTGWVCANPGRRAISSFTFGLYFIVQDPSG